MDPRPKTFLVSHRVMLFEEVTCVPTTQMHRMFPVDRLTLVNAHPARSRIKCKISHPRIFDLIIRGFPGNWIPGSRQRGFNSTRESRMCNRPATCCHERGIVQTPLSITDDQRTVSTDDPHPTNGVLVKREISEGLETIAIPRSARNGDVQPTVRDSANRDSKPHKTKKNHQTGSNRFSYSDALRRNWHEWHNRDWWRQHCNNIVFVTGGYYFLDASYWYPAYGYDPLNNYYDYDGPIYTYGNLLPDQVIANVQAALQDAGYYFGSVTGSLSVETRAALLISSVTRD